MNSIQSALQHCLSGCIKRIDNLAPKLAAIGIYGAIAATVTLAALAILKVLGVTTIAGLSIGFLAHKTLVIGGVASLSMFLVGMAYLGCFFTFGELVHKA